MPVRVLYARSSVIVGGTAEDDLPVRLPGTVFAMEDTWTVCTTWVRVKSPLVILATLGAGVTVVGVTVACTVVVEVGTVVV